MELPTACGGTEPPECAVPEGSQLGCFWHLRISTKGQQHPQNELYRDRYVWNRSQWLKDPDTEKRQRLARPESEWQTVERTELHIIEVALWAAVRTRQRTPRRGGGSVGRGPKPRTLLSRLLRYGMCSGAVVAVDASHCGCAARNDRGASICEGVRAARSTLEQRVAQKCETPYFRPLRSCGFRNERRRRSPRAFKAPRAPTPCARRASLSSTSRWTT